MTYLIDTNIVSEICKGKRGSPSVRRWWSDVDDDDLFLSVLNLGEIRRGIESVRPRDAKQAHALEQWLVAVIEAFAGRVLPIDQAICDEWGRMNAIRSYPVIDSLLAATAKVHKLTLVTRNVMDVLDTGAELLNPFEQDERIKNGD